MKNTRAPANDNANRNQTGFDLWEEVSGASFFTTISQYRALVEGSTLAAQLQTTCEACDEIAPHVLCFLQSYWSNQGYVISNSASPAHVFLKNGWQLTHPSAHECRPHWKGR